MRIKMEDRVRSLLEDVSNEVDAQTIDYQGAMLSIMGSIALSMAVIADDLSELNQQKGEQ